AGVPADPAPLVPDYLALRLPARERRHLAWEHGHGSVSANCTRRLPEPGERRAPLRHGPRESSRAAAPAGPPSAAPANGGNPTPGGGHPPGRPVFVPAPRRGSRAPRGAVATHRLRVGAGDGSLEKD